jgi:nitroreductase
LLDVIHAIQTRQSVGRVRQDPVPEAFIERILESAVHAPNHRITEPWRFHVFTGKGRGELARARAEAGRDEVETLENYAACAAAVQNMQLTAHSLGLASIWRTGPVAYHKHMRAFFRLEEGDKIVAYLYVGYSDMGKRPRRRSPAGEKTVWHGG